MALVIYHDFSCTSPVSASSPDNFNKAVPWGNDAIDIRQFWIKSDDPDLTYKNITIEAVNDDDGASMSGQIDVTYSLDNTAYSQSITLPDGDYSTPVSFWRKVYSPCVEGAFSRTNIVHQITADEYCK